MVSNEPWQWYGPIKPNDKDATGVYMLSVDLLNGTYFWVFSAAQDAVFNPDEWKWKEE